MMRAGYTRKRKHELDEVKEDRSKFSKFGFLTSFKGVVLEGLEDRL